MQCSLPSAKETVLFALAAIVFSVIVNIGASPELRLAGLSIPLFIAASLMGFRRYRRLRHAHAAMQIAE